MKTIKWFGALTLLGAATAAAIPASAVVCWTPSMIPPIAYVPISSSATAYLECTGVNVRAEATGRMVLNSVTGKRSAEVRVHSGDQATVWGYDSNRNFIAGCFVQRNGVGVASSPVCSVNPTFMQLEAKDE